MIEQLVIWDYILVELSLEVQGGQDYFRFVEGTCITACVVSSSVLYIYPLHINSELTQTLNYFRLWTWEQFFRTWKKKFPKTQFNPPFLWFFSPSETSFAQSELKETYLNNYKELNKVLNTWYTIRGIHNTIRTEQTLFYNTLKNSKIWTIERIL